MELIHKIAIFSLVLGGLCALIIFIDIPAGHRQKMMVMNFVYPISALYAGPLALIFYYKIGRKSVEKKSKQGDKMDGEKHQNKKPFWQSVAIGALHCGSGCTLGDIVAETLLLFVPVVIFGSSLAGT